MKSAVQLPKSIMKQNHFYYPSGIGPTILERERKDFRRGRKKSVRPAVRLLIPRSGVQGGTRQVGVRARVVGDLTGPAAFLLSSSNSLPPSLRPSTLRQKQTWTMNVRWSPMSNHSISSLHHSRHVSFSLSSSFLYSSLQLKIIPFLRSFISLITKYLYLTKCTSRCPLGEKCKNQRRNPFENNVNARQEFPEFAKNWLPA